MTTRTTRIAGALLAGTLTLGFAAPALAQEEAPVEEAERHYELDALKAKCDRAIERRLGDLATATRRLDEVGTLTDAHEATLDGIIAATVAGLTDLRSEIAAAPDVPSTLRLCSTIASGYRVYLVVLPQAHLTVGADRSDFAIDLSEALVVEFDEAVERAIEAGADVTEAVALMDQAEDHLDAADVANDGVADSVLGITPQSWNDGPGKAALEAARASMHTTHSELKAANEDGKAALRALRDAVADVTP